MTEDDPQVVQYLQKLAHARKRRDRVISAAEATPRVHEGRPHVIQRKEGFEVHLKSFGQHAEHGVRIDVEIYKGGVLVHKDDHVIINPPSQTMIDGVMVEDPIAAILETVLAASGVRK